MRKTMFGVLAMTALAACQGPMAGAISGQNLYEVYGVEEGDMLKLRAGPGTGFDILAGLPNGTVVRAHHCERLGHTRWCQVALDRSPATQGYVSQSYLRKM